MRLRRLVRLALVAVPVLLALTFVASAATTTVEPSAIDDVQRSVSVRDLRPDACGQSVTHLIVATGAISGTASNDLILGGPDADLISGEGGDDCIVGGGGADQIAGNGGDDTCIGGPGSDLLDPSCETEIP